MYWKIEPTGCCVKEKDKNQIAIQVRFCIYLDPLDKGYYEHIIDELKLKDTSIYKEEYTIDDFVKTGKKIKTPLHNHIIELPIDSTDNLIESIGNQVLQIVEDYHSKGYFDRRELIYIQNTLYTYDLMTNESLKQGELRLSKIKTASKWLK
jgi:hypothetical protein